MVNIGSEVDPLALPLSKDGRLSQGKNLRIRSLLRDLDSPGQPLLCSSVFHGRLLGLNVDILPPCFLTLSRGLLELSWCANLGRLGFGFQGRCHDEADCRRLVVVGVCVCIGIETRPSECIN